MEDKISKMETNEIKKAVEKKFLTNNSDKVVTGVEFKREFGEVVAEIHFEKRGVSNG